MTERQEMLAKELQSLLSRISNQTQSTAPKDSNQSEPHTTMVISIKNLEIRI